MFLEIGTSKTPNDVMFWLASGSMLYQIIRSILIAFLLGQVLTNPPRHTWFRLTSGAVAIAITVWALQATISFIMPAMDTFAFLAGSIALLLAALERSFENPAKKSLARQTTLKNSFQS